MIELLIVAALLPITVVSVFGMFAAILGGILVCICFTQT